MIKNDHTINGDVTTLHVTRRNGDKFDVLMDTEDLKILDENNYLVHVSWSSRARAYYAEVCMRYTDESGKRKGSTVMLHGLIMNKVHNKDNSIKVDHINNENKLDNRKSNLRVTTQLNNSKNRKSRNSNNKSGYRNVSFIDGRYIVQLQIDGKNTRIGSFKDVHEAGKFAEKMRQVHYGKFAGDN